jgi:inosine-uridine nucleoside N-ribohydrolase
MPKIHIDTDIGGDMDDLCALAMVLQWPAAELTGVSTVAEHVGTEHRGGKRAGFVRHVLKLAGRADDVRVAAGAEASLDCYRSWQGLPDEAVYWPEPIEPFGRYGRGDPALPDPFPEGRTPYPPTEIVPALDLLERSIVQGAVIAAIGPFTNLALLEKRSPGILRSARLVLMGGYVYPPHAGYPAWGHEMDWNAQVDVQSALFVIEHSDPILVTLAVTVETALRRAYLPRLRQSGPLGQLIARQAEATAIEYKNETTFGLTCKNLPADLINFQHDPLACAIALGWDEGVEIHEIPLKSEIQDGWLRQTIEDGGKPTRVVTAVNGERFNEFWLNMVTR